jgi:spermidine synthase
MTQNVAAIPFLWVLPLSLYLMSFIVCFDRETWYRRWLFIPLLAAALGGMAWSMLDIENISIKPLILLFSAGLFFACIVCHGELARLKPHPRHLTSFYLMISLGGALGGLVVGLAAPYLLNGEYELPAILAACAVLAAALPFRTPLPRPLKWLGAAAATGIIVTLAVGVHTTVEDNRLRVRNFYGSLRVLDSGGGREAVRRLLHGAIDHGEQYLSPEGSRQATTYYGTNSGVGVAIRHFQSPGQRMGFIGLGAGTLAAYGRRGDSYRFYEINPLVERIARTEFQYLRQSEAAVAVALGDARLSLEQEAPRQFSVLAVDAFSGDAIPVHLLTREAFQLYFRHLDPDGILAVHISNRYLDLQPVVEQAARSLGKETLTVESASDDDRDVFESTWVLVAGQPFQDAAFKAAGVKAQAGRTIRTWTDEYSNLFQVLR